MVDDTKSKLDQEHRVLPFSAKLGIYYDEGFANKFGTEAVNVVRRVMAHAQNIWMWSASLGSKVIFDIVKVEPKPGFWVTDDYLL